MASTEVVGRDEELASIEAFLAGIERGPSALLLAGEAGIGKTVLWAAGVEEAREQLDHVLTCRGMEAEATLSFAGLTELLAPVVDDALSALVPLRRRALETALLLVEPGDVAPDAHVIGLAVLDVLRALARDGPVALAVDDVQWLDSASAGVLQVALRRLRDEPVGLLATVRAASGLSSPLDVERCFSPERFERLSVGPVSLGALHHLLRDRLGLDLSRPDVVRLQAVTGGNPFFGLELGRELQRTNTRPTAGPGWRVPDSLAQLLEERLSRMPTDTGDVLLQVAALARPTVDVVAAAQGDRERVLVALDAAVREGVIELDDPRMGFAHPLHASICYERAPLWKRRAVHRVLAGVVTDVEERARHLARSAEGPDEAVAAELETAAEHAAARGATAAGAELLEQAAELTACDPAAARRRRLQAATLHRLAGDRERSTAVLEQLRSEVPPGVERSDVLFELVSTLNMDGPAMIRICDEALAEAAGDDARGARILSKRTWAHLFAADARSALLDAQAALERAERTGDPALLAVALCSVGQAEMWTAEVTPGLLERAVEIEEAYGLLLEHLESPRASLARLLMRRGDVDRSRALHEDLERIAAARGDEHGRVYALWNLGMLEWRAGEWQRALALGIEARDLAEQTQAALERAYVGRMNALVEADLGMVAESRASAMRGLALAEEMSNRYYAISSLGCLGRLELALGNLDAAGDYLRDLPAELLALGFNDPSTPLWADSIEALVALGELDRAGGYLEHYEVHARRVESPWAVASAARCRGLLRAATGDLAGATADLELALSELEGFTYPFERGRALLALGSVHRQAQRKSAAREALEAALVIFEELGARLWAGKARTELGRISGRRAPADELTETEHQVAVLAAQGLTNNEIAATLFMGVSTVEAHLSRVYRKLGVRRAELATRLPL